MASRNPEGLLDLACHLQWVEDALTGAGQTFPSTLAGVRDSLVLTLRSLRHADGALPRFHGGGAGRDGLLDRVLAGSPVTTRRDGRSAMGFARLSARRSSVIMDASAPPTEGAALTGHASTLAFELTSGRRPIIVNCGPGQHFGSDWRRAARATAGHSVLCVEAYSSAQLGKPDPGTGLEPLTNAPAKVLCDFLRLDGADRIQGVHSGYDASHGLTHARMLDLDHDGRCLQGEDRLMVASDAARPRFDAAMRAGGGGVPVYIRFHLHPDVAAGLSSDHKTATLALRSGERWEFTHEGGFNLSIEPSVYLDPDEMTPLASKQVVLSGRAMKYATPIRWSLRKTDDTAQAVRDLAQGDDDTDL